MEGGQQNHTQRCAGSRNFFRGGSNNNVDLPKNHGTLQSKGSHLYDARGVAGIPDVIVAKQYHNNKGSSQREKPLLFFK